MDCARLTGAFEMGNPFGHRLLLSIQNGANSCKVFLLLRPDITSKYNAGNLA